MKGDSRSLAFRRFSQQVIISRESTRLNSPARSSNAAHYHGLTNRHIASYHVTSMANHISALKRVRQTKTRTSRNRVRKTRVRHQMRELRKALKGQDATKASAALPETIRLIDRAAQK